MHFRFSYFQPNVISLVDQQQPSFPGSIALQPELNSTLQPENRVHEEKKEDPMENGSSKSTSGVIAPAILPSSLIENKEPQQVITLVNQLPPSVSSPVAIQPTAQQVFDFYRPPIQTHPTIPVTPNQQIERGKHIQDQQMNPWQTPQQFISPQEKKISQQTTPQQITIPQLTTPQQFTMPQKLTMSQQLTTPYQLMSHSQYSQNSYPQSHEFHYAGTNSLNHSVTPQEVSKDPFCLLKL